MANTKVTGDLIASGTITASNLVSGTLDTLLDGYLTTNTYATQSYVTTAVNNLIAAAPASLDTLNELAAALNDDANFATTVTNSLATKLNLTGGNITGNFSVDTDTLYVDAAANTVGIGTDTPIVNLHIKDSGAIIARLESTTDANTTIHFGDSADADVGKLTYAHSDNSMQFVVNASERMRIDSSGRVGIGTTSPLVKLSLGGGIGQKLNVYESGNTRIGLGADIGGSGHYGLSLYTNVSMTFGKISTSDGSTFTEFARFNSSGNLGIGTTTPTAPLHVEGGASSEVLKIEANADPYIRWVENGTNVGFLQFKGGEAYLSNQSNGAFFFRTNNTNKMVITSDGRVGIGTTSPETALEIYKNASQGNPSNHTPANATLKIQDSSNQMYLDGNSIIQTGSASFTIGNTQASNILFYTDATERFRIDSSGNVGIGTTSPKALLDISRNAGADPSPVDDPVTLRLTDSGNAANGLGDTTNPWAEIQFYSEDASSGGPAVQAKIATIYDDVYSAGSHIAFYNTATPTNGLSERIRITSIGRVGIGVSSPTAKLQVEDNVNGEVAVRIHNAASNAGSTAALTIDTTGNNFAIRQYPDADTSNANKTKFVTTAGGGHFTFEAGGSEQIRISSNGLTFNGDTAAANALDDYEEGTWTPTFPDAVNVSSVALSGTAVYTKIGRVVHLAFEVSGQFISASGESLFSFTLPFTAASTTMDHVGTATFFIGSGANRFGIGSVFEGTTSNGKTYIYIPAREVQQSGSWGQMRISLTYFAA